MDILADSGIILRLYHTPDPLHPTIDRAVYALRAGGHDLSVAFHNLTEFWNVSTRPKTARGGFGLSQPETERRLGVIERGFPRLDEPPAAYPNWRKLVVAHQVQGKQVHDARLVALMQAHGITHVLTLNGADFVRYPGIVVIDPVTFAAPAPPVPPPPPTS